MPSSSAMSSPAKCIVEVPVAVQKVLEVERYSHKSNSSSRSVLVHSRGLQVVNSESGEIFQTFNLDQDKRRLIVDCVYLDNFRSFLLALSDSTLMLVPNTCVDLSLCQAVLCPAQPTGLRVASVDTVLVMSAGAALLRLRLTETGVLGQIGEVQNRSVRPGVAISKGKGGKSQSGTEGQCNNSEWCVLADGSVAVVNSTGNALKYWPRSDSAVPGSSEWLDATDARNIDLMVVDNQQAHRVVGVVFAQNSAAVCVVTATEYGGGKIVKVNVHSGKVVYTRDLFTVPLQCAYTAGSLWILHSGKPEDNVAAKNGSKKPTSGVSSASCWDVAYGVEAFSTELKVPAGVSSTANASTWIQAFGSDSAAATTSSSALSPLLSRHVHCLYTVGLGDGQATAVWRSILLPARGADSSVASEVSTSTSTSGRVQLTGLCAVIGRLRTAEDVLVLENKTKSNTVDKRVLSSLSGKKRRQLQRAKEAYEKQLQLEAEEHGKDFDDVAERLSKRDRKFYLDIPVDAASEFLEKLAGASPEDLLSSDWDVMKVLIRAGTLSLTENPAVLPLVVAAQRLDVIAEILSYVVDLSESQAVDLLLTGLLCPTSVSDRVSVSCGRLKWGRTTAADGEPASVTAMPAKGSKKSKKDKKNVSSTPESGHHQVHVMCAIVGSLLQRKAAFSSVMLAAAVRSRSDVSSAVLLLRFFVWSLQDVCMSAEPVLSEGSEGETVYAKNKRVANTFSQAGIYVGDAETLRAVSWIEAIIDGHFSALSFHTVSHAPTRDVLSTAMRTISGARRCSTQTTELLGIWSHIGRVIHSGGEMVRPITGIYQVEDLIL